MRVTGVGDGIGELRPMPMHPMGPPDGGRDL